MKLTVIGAGFAGCEAAWQAANAGVDVLLCEMKPKRYSPAHTQETFAELICSNSFKAERVESAAGLLKEEMARLGSLCVPCAKACRVPAGGALAVDRSRFSKMVTEKISAHPRITVQLGEVTSIPEDGIIILATGPLTDGMLGQEIARLTGGYLNFYDAAAPIVLADSIDMDLVFAQSRYDRGEGDDYLNCPMNKEEYEAFYEALIHAESAPLHEFDTPTGVYEGCMPVEVMARRGQDTIRFGPLKPVGLRDPRTGHRPWAVVQLRKENSAGTMYNLVGFQTNLKFGEQKRVFSMIPGLGHGEFVRYGVMHRNSFIDSPKLLGPDFCLKERENLYFAGQITGVEGYMESAAAGLLAGKNAVRKLLGKAPLLLPETTMLGALSRYISDKTVKNFQPMGANFGILPPLPERVRDKKLRYAALAQRGLKDLEHMLSQEPDSAERKGEDENHC